jgi:hypothetical protein
MRGVSAEADLLKFGWVRRPGEVLLRGYDPSQGDVVQFHPLPFLEAEEYYRFDLRAGWDPSLESGDGPALWTHLAGPIADRGILQQRQ